MRRLPIPGQSAFLLVDDDDRLRERLSLALTDRGFSVVTASSPAQALGLCGDGLTHAIVDLRMPEGSGLELLGALLHRQPGLQVVVLTGYGSIATAVEAMRQGAVNYLTKPADADTILGAFSPHVPQETAVEPPSLARTEWEHIQRVLNDCGGNISLAARKLGMHRRTLQRKLAVLPPRR